jgi:rhodanese-related sulfurtransferase
VLIDIRTAAQRAVGGEIPGSVVIERNHLEWRLDPQSDARLPWVTGYHLRPVVICAAGYTSSLAAAALVELGLHRSADLAGGFVAWEAAGMPTVPGPDVAYRGDDMAHSTRLRTLAKTPTSSLTGTHNDPIPEGRTERAGPPTGVGERTGP